ncbi:MAG: glycosyltransferase family 2 protein [Candidatus Shapirobacteria bacterium]|jgi:GT2 family glycosyltransferase
MIPKKRKKSNKSKINQPTGISIVIPNWNGQAFLPSCLNSLLTSIKKTKNILFEIILVDNASTDKSVSIFKSSVPAYQRTKVLRLRRNTGFVYAVNRGIEASQFDYVCICNNDLTVDQNWFTEIVKAIQRTSEPANHRTSEPITTFSGLVLNKDGTKIESRGLRFYPYGKAENIANGLPFSKTNIHHLSSKNYLIWGSSASIVIYHKPTILKVGLFDERFFAYEEDVDLAYRLNKSGFKTLFVPTAISYHLGGGTSSKMGNFRQQMDFKNWILLIAKNYSFREILANSPVIFIERLRNLSGVVKSTPLPKLPQTLFSVFSQTLSALIQKK